MMREMLLALRKILNRYAGALPYLLMLAIFIFLSVRALFHEGFFRTIDDITTVRIIYLVKELRRFDLINQFPVRWSGELAHQYGYPVYLFYAPLTYYAGALLMIFGGFSGVVATKWVYAFPLILGPLFAYWAMRQRMDRLSALAAAVLYALFPFRGYDIYTRGGVGESWSMAFLPLIFGGLFLLEKGSSVGGLIFSLALCLAVISHNISGVMIVAFVTLFVLLFHRRDYHFWRYLLLGLALSVFFWLPAAYYLNVVRVNYSPQNTGQLVNFLEPIKNLLVPEIPHNPEGRFSAAFAYLLLLGVIFLVAKWKRLSIEIKKVYFFWALAGWGFYLLMFTPFKFVWDLTSPVSRFVQFPWRSLVLTSFILPFFFGFTLSLINHKYFKLFLSVALMAGVLIFLPTFKPRGYSYFYEYSAEDSGPCATSWGEEYLPLWVLDCATNPVEQPVEVDGGTVNLTENFVTRMEMNVDAGSHAQLVVYKYYFPGWKIFVDDREAELAYRFSRNGIFRASIPPGSHEVKVIFSKTPLMWIADFLSLVAVFYFLVQLKAVLFRKAMSKMVKTTPQG
jgi:hypothetical protein